jgi:hypothetical protein
MNQHQIVVKTSLKCNELAPIVEPKPLVMTFQTTSYSLNQSHGFLVTDRSWTDTQSPVGIEFPGRDRELTGCAVHMVHILKE